jgi:cytoskeletal protein RodZ
MIKQVFVYLIVLGGVGLLVWFVMRASKEKPSDQTLLRSLVIVSTVQPDKPEFREKSNRRSHEPK